MGLMGFGIGTVFLQRKQRHHKARGTKTALRAVAVDHCLLHAVQLALMLEVFNADQLFAMQGANERQARIEAAVAQPLNPLFVGM